MTDGEWCWISADGHLESGSEGDLFRAHAKGRIPNDNPVWCPSQNAWRTMYDLLAGQQPAVDPLDDAATLRRDAVTPTQADELVPSTRRELPWFEREELELPTEKLPASEERAEPDLRIPPTPSLRPFARTVPPASSRTLPIWIGAGVAAAGALFAAVLLGSALAHRAPSSVAHLERELGTALGGSGLRSPAPPATACSTRVTPLRIAPYVVPSSPLTVATFGSKIAVGAVTSQRAGVGISLAADDLSVVSTDWLADARQLSAVVPSNDDGFIADRWTTSVPGTNEFSVGMTPKGFSRIDADYAQHQLWPADPREAITRPAIARAPGHGWVIAFRRADGPGSVKLGWIDEQGTPRAELSSFADGAERASAPSVAVNGKDVVLAFSEQRADGSSVIRLGRAALGQVPGELVSLGEQARSPAIAALDGGRWLLVYVAGSASRTLSAQLLSEDLAPIGAPKTLSDAPSGSPSVAIWTNGRRAAVIFTVDRGRERGELWATALDCG